MAGGKQAKGKAAPRKKAAPRRGKAAPRKKAVPRKKTAAPHKKARRRAPQRGSEAALAAWLGAMAHEVRTPLTGILAAAELLSTGDYSPQELALIESVRASARHLADLTTLWVEAGRAARGAAADETFSPREMAQALAASLTARAQAKGLSAEIAVADLPERAQGSGVRLRAALENLIDNAAKFTEQGKVRFTATAARAAGGRCRLSFSVADTGIGFSPAEARRLFRPYAQAHAAIAARFGGAGLGLAFAKTVAEEWGGTLDFRSTKGKGARFTLTLFVTPVAVPAAERARPAGPGRALRLLAVEDNPMGRMVLKTLLEALGHAVQFAGSGERALALLGEKSFDAVLMDMVLPGIGGAETAARIRRLPAPAGRVPVIGISGGDVPADRAKALQAVLTKPLTPAALAAALDALVPA